jgi:hypothetical protein
VKGEGENAGTAGLQVIAISFQYPGRGIVEMEIHVPVIGKEQQAVTRPIGGPGASRSQQQVKWVGGNRAARRIVFDAGGKALS